MSFPSQHRVKLHSTDEMDKRFVGFCAILCWRGRPCSEERRIGCERRQAAYPSPAGLRRPRTPLVFLGSGSQLNGAHFSRVLRERVQIAVHTFSLVTTHSCPNAGGVIREMLAYPKLLNKVVLLLMGVEL